MKSDRGLASLPPSKRKEIARKGGEAVQKRGTAHRWLKGSQEAKDAAEKSLATRRTNKLARDAEPKS